MGSCNSARHGEQPAPPYNKRFDPLSVLDPLSVPVVRNVAHFLTTMSVYLINASQPRFATIQITRQKRNENQSAGEIELSSIPPKIAESGARP